MSEITFLTNCCWCHVCCNCQFGLLSFTKVVNDLSPSETFNHCKFRSTIPFLLAFTNSNFVKQFHLELSHLLQVLHEKKGDAFAFLQLYLLATSSLVFKQARVSWCRPYLGDSFLAHMMFLPPLWEDRTLIRSQAICIAGGFRLCTSQPLTNFVSFQAQILVLKSIGVFAWSRDSCLCKPASGSFHQHSVDCFNPHLF